MCQRHTDTQYPYTNMYKLRWIWKPTSFGIKSAKCIEEYSVVLGYCRHHMVDGGWVKLCCGKALFVTMIPSNLFNYSNSLFWHDRRLSMRHKSLHKWICVFHIPRCIQQLVPCSVLNIQTYFIIPFQYQWFSEFSNSLPHLKRKDVIETVWWPHFYSFRNVCKKFA